MVGRCEMRRLFSMGQVKATPYSLEQQMDRLVAGLSRAAAAPVVVEEHIVALPGGIVGTVADNITAEDFFPNFIGCLAACRELYRKLDTFFETVID